MGKVELAEKKYCFSENEFTLLLDAAGITNLLCFNLQNGKTEFEKLTEIEKNKIILKLIQTGILTIEGENYRVNSDVRRVFKVLGNYKYYIHFTKGTTGLTYGIYVGEESFLASETDGTGKDYIRISYHESDELTDYLNKNGIIEVYDETNKYSREFGVSDEDDSIEIFDGNSYKLLCSISIKKRNGIPDRIETHKGSFAYSSGILTDLIGEIIGGHTDDIG